MIEAKFFFGSTLVYGSYMDNKILGWFKQKFGPFTK